MSLLSTIWNLRNEPAATLFGAAVLLATILVGIVLLHQHFVKNAPLVCGDKYLPQDNLDCKSSADSADSSMPNLDEHTTPIGTIVAYFGSEPALPKGWSICDGRDNPPESKITFDANKERGGIQLPDLRGRFLRGFTNSLDKNQMIYGGTDSINLRHSHQWATYKHPLWTSYNHRGLEFYLYEGKDTDGDGRHGEGHYPLILLSKDTTSLFTSLEGMKNVLPRFAEVQYIIRTH